MKKILIFLLSIVVVPLLGFSQYGFEQGRFIRSFDDARLIRITYVSGEAFVRRSYEDGFEEAMVNLPVFDRDVIGTTDGRLELYLGRFNHLRLDYDTEIEFEQVPILGKTGMRIRINRGGVYFAVRNLDLNGDIEIQTPDCGVYLLDNGNYRINVQEYGGSEILVYRGMTEINGEREGFEVGSSFQVNFLEGRLIQRPFPIPEQMRDDFLVWNVSRNLLQNRIVGYASRYLDPRYAYYEYELNAAGQWRFDRTYNRYVWIPYQTGISWKPYFQGRWTRHPVYGLVWVSYDPWGWYTHYYGRWHWSPYNGWYWIPGEQWSPAWVAWSWTDNYYGWCPLSIWNKPVIVINNQWVRNYQYDSGFPYDSLSVIVVAKENIWSPQIQNNVLPRKVLSQLRFSRLNFRGTAPEIRHVPRLVSVTNAKGRTVQYKKSGFLSRSKYNIERSGPGKPLAGKEIYVYKQPETNPEQKFSQINRYSGPQKDDKTEPVRVRKVETSTSRPRYPSISRQKSQQPRKDMPEKKDTARMETPRSESGEQIRKEKQDQKRISPEPMRSSKKAEIQKTETRKIEVKDTSPPATQKGIRKEKQDQKRISPKPVKASENVKIQKAGTKKAPALQKDKSIKSTRSQKGEKQVQKASTKSDESKDTKKKKAKKEKQKKSKSETKKDKDKDKG